MKHKRFLRSVLLHFCDRYRFFFVVDCVIIMIVWSLYILRLVSLLVTMFHCLITPFVYFHWYMQDTQKQHKNELLFQKFGINYKTLPELFRQGSCLFKKKVIVYTFLLQIIYTALFMLVLLCDVLFRTTTLQLSASS